MNSESKTGWGFGKENSQVKLDVTQSLLIISEKSKRNLMFGNK